MSLNGENKQFLIIRFSSFGDVLLTTALLRNLKTNFPDCHITFIVKKPFNQMLDNNPNIDTCLIYKSIEETVAQLDGQNFDYLIDLQHNPLSLRLKKKINHHHYFHYDKQSFKRFYYLKSKRGKFNLPIKSVPQRYIDAVKLNLQIDSTRPDFFPDQSISTESFQLPKTYICIAPGAAHFTKQWPVEQFISLIKKIQFELKTEIVLIGGTAESATADQIANTCNVLNFVGKLSFAESALVIKTAKLVICNDSSIMHFARVYQRPIICFFGSTTERFGFFPYETKFIALENNDLKCRPCSHYGRSKCPKGHFNCMKSISADIAYQSVLKLLENE